MRHALFILAASVFLVGAESDEVPAGAGDCGISLDFWMVDGQMTLYHRHGADLLDGWTHAATYLNVGQHMAALGGYTHEHEGAHEPC